jgi:hypothetical protein
MEKVEQQHLQSIAWSILIMLLTFMCFVHVGMQASFLTSGSLIPWIAPISFLLAIIVGHLLVKQLGLNGFSSYIPSIATLLICIVSVFLSVLFFDLSWDGQWYHQTAVYKIAEGWNPLSTPMHNFDEHNDMWIRHYAKSSWYISAALFKTFQHIEWAKAITWITLVTAFLAVFVVMLEYGFSKLKSVAIALVVALNPVTTCSLYSFQVDGILISLLVCYVASLFSFFRHSNKSALLVGICSALLSINMKFTGLVFLCFFAAAAGVYLLLRHRQLFMKFVLMHALVVVVGVGIMGYNPYITNTIHRGHPFFPILGTKEHPGFEQEGADDIEKWETPDNLKGQPRLKRLTYGIFGRPGAQPWIDGRDAKLMIPFGATLHDIALYRFMDVRISGLGPYFSGTLLLSLVLMIIVFFQKDSSKLILALCSVTIVVTLLISNHTWWARYAPQLWWLPILPLIAVFFYKTSIASTRFAWLILILLFINAMLVIGVHLQWEINATRTLQQQLEDIKKRKATIEVDFQWFGTPVGERFKTWEIPYQTVKQDSLSDGEKLMSVVEGYPGCVRYKILSLEKK